MASEGFDDAKSECVFETRNSSTLTKNVDRIYISIT